MTAGNARPPVGRALPVLVAAYFAASIAHFAHNAEYIASYPNMPHWLMREHVYAVWAAITAVGLLGLGLLRLGWGVLGALVLAAYGAMGLDGLGHYALELCSQHTLAMNATIWAEAASGVALAATCVAFAIACARRA